MHRERLGRAVRATASRPPRRRGSPPRTAPPAMPPTNLIAGRFELLRAAGAGGMGTVYEARDRLTGATVALKLLHHCEDGQRDRFVREAIVLAELRHPAIVRYV